MTAPTLPPSPALPTTARELADLIGDAWGPEAEPRVTDDDDEAASSADITRDARPGHFDAAAKHGFSLLAVGMPRSLLATMSRGALARGLTDAAAGYDHALLRATVAELS